PSSPSIYTLSLHDALPISLPGDRYVEFVFASAIYFYGGWPFLTGLVAELRKRLPGMMTLVGLALSVAYLYSAAVVMPGSRLRSSDRKSTRLNSSHDQISYA